MLVEIGRFAIGYASSSLQLEVAVLPVKIKKTNQPALLVSNYNTLTGKSFKEFHQIFLMLIKMANHYDYWLIIAEDGNFCLDSKKHDNFTKGAKLIAAAKVQSNDHQ